MPNKTPEDRRFARLIERNGFQYLAVIDSSEADDAGEHDLALTLTTTTKRGSRLTLTMDFGNPKKLEPWQALAGFTDDHIVNALEKGRAQMAGLDGDDAKGGEA